MLGEMLNVIDKLVLDELSRRDKRLSQLADRSHAMLAEYPGQGLALVHVLAQLEHIRVTFMRHVGLHGAQRQLNFS